ncbi:MAG: sulfatase-like hydrolase/transferase, partial [Verrucomicrobiales bacterium]
MTSKSRSPSVYSVCSVVSILLWLQPFSGAAPPNIILVMADDMGWGQTGYYHHPVLETPNLDAMADNGLRLDRFYAGA